MNNLDKAIQIGEQLGLKRTESSCDYSYLRKVKDALIEKPGSSFSDLAYVQKLIDELEKEPDEK